MIYLYFQQVALDIYELVQAHLQLLLFRKTDIAIRPLKRAKSPLPFLRSSVSVQIVTAPIINEKMPSPSPTVFRASVLYSVTYMYDLGGWKKIDGPAKFWTG
jgi:hypothetical protein